MRFRRTITILDLLRGLEDVVIKYQCLVHFIVCWWGVNYLPSNDPNHRLTGPSGNPHKHLRDVGKSCRIKTFSLSFRNNTLQGSKLKLAMSL